eukprot:TRINITY_DN1263_c0_g3_i5.p3 TRINITY_DN1263_c0_g3~~TRINITY_DN1263_c0_g3_i5.p3  ORF type:complete len:100 (-),score=19.73 TRINITY_DN1263_c0_g3_i5:173-472(-)
MQKSEEEYKAQKEPQEAPAPPVTAAPNYSGQYYQRKRYRRTAEEIERRFRCPVENCNKAYGCEGSLNQHIKIKHPELYGSQGKIMAESLRSKEEDSSEQ